MDQIEPDALYDERADVSRARPLLQGDVFDDVVLPGFGEEPRRVQILSEPPGLDALLIAVNYGASAPSGSTCTPSGRR